MASLNNHIHAMVFLNRALMLINYIPLINTESRREGLSVLGYLLSLAKSKLNPLAIVEKFIDDACFKSRKEILEELMASNPKFLKSSSGYLKKMRRLLSLVDSYRKELFSKYIKPTSERVI